MPTFTILKPPASGTAITRKNGRLVVPDDPIIPFIEGDGTGPDIWRASVRVLDAAVEEGVRREEADRVDGSATPARRASSSSTTGCPTTRSRRSARYYVGIKGPLTTPVGGGIRSLNVALRQLLDLYVCLRPVRWYQRRAVAGQASREGRHGDLPREHGRHLRGHRVRRRHAGSAEGARFLRAGVPEGVQEDPLRHREAAAAHGRRRSKRSARRTARSASRSASASSRSAISAPSGWSTARSATPSPTSARASRWCTRATS